MKWLTCSLVLFLGAAAPAFAPLSQGQCPACTGTTTVGGTVWIEVDDENTPYDQLAGVKIPCSMSTDWLWWTSYQSSSQTAGVVATVTASSGGWDVNVQLMYNDGGWQTGPAFHVWTTGKTDCSQSPIATFDLSEEYGVVIKLYGINPGAGGGGG